MQPFVLMSPFLAVFVFIFALVLCVCVVREGAEWEGDFCTRKILIFLKVDILNKKVNKRPLSSLYWELSTCALKYCNTIGWYLKADIFKDQTVCSVSLTIHSNQSFIPLWNQSIFAVQFKIGSNLTWTVYNGWKTRACNWSELKWTE